MTNFNRKSGYKSEAEQSHYKLNGLRHKMKNLILPFVVTVIGQTTFAVELEATVDKTECEDKDEYDYSWDGSSCWEHHYFTVYSSDCKTGRAG